MSKYVNEINVPSIPSQTSGAAVGEGHEAGWEYGSHHGPCKSALFAYWSVLIVVIDRLLPLEIVEVQYYYYGWEVGRACEGQFGLAFGQVDSRLGC